jgi:Domain of unknown function (DUF4397)
VSPLSGNQARARAIHAAAQAPSVDIYASEAGATTALTDLVPIVRDLQYGQAGEGGEINAGSFDVKLTATGTDTVAAEVDGLTVDAGQVYSFVIIGTPGDTDKPLTIVPVSVPAGT